MLELPSFNDIFHPHLYILFFTIQIFEYRDAMLILAGLLTMNILGALTYKQYNRSTDDDNVTGYTWCKSLGDSFRAIISPVLIAYLVNTLLWNGGNVVLRVLLYSYIEDSYGSSYLAGLSSTLYGVGQIVMTIIMSVLNTKLPTNKYMIHLICVAVMGCSACLMGFIDSVYVIVVLTCLYGGMYGVVLSNIANLVKHLNGRRSHNMFYAMSQTSGGIGALVSPPLLGWLQQTLPIKTLFFFSSGLSFTSFLVMLIMLLIKRELWHPYHDPGSQTNEEAIDGNGQNIELADAKST